MSILREYGVTPQVFQKGMYSSDEVCSLRLAVLTDILLRDGIVRNLRNGEWWTSLVAKLGTFHPVAKEMLESIAKEGRLRPCPLRAASSPSCEADWVREAWESRSWAPLDQIVSAEQHAGVIPASDLAMTIHSMDPSQWWRTRGESVRLARTSMEYQRVLRVVLHASRYLVLIDPYLDPCVPRYSGVLKLLLESGRADPKPRIEIHRMEGPTKNARIPLREWERRFRVAWGPALTKAHLNVQVFIWEKFHDRYLISNLVGISMANGFDENPRCRTTWTRISRQDKEEVLREFDPNCHLQVLVGNFSVG